MGKSLPISGVTCVLLLAVFISGIAAAAPNNASTADAPVRKMVITTWNRLKWEGYEGEVRVRCAYRDNNAELGTLGTAYLRKGQHTEWEKDLDEDHVKYIRCEYLWNLPARELSYFVYDEDNPHYHTQALVASYAIQDPGLFLETSDGKSTLVEEWF